MKHIAKTLPALAVAAGMALVMVTSGFTKANTDPLWVLKSGAQVGSIDPSDYEQGAPNCPGTIHFCAFQAPESATPGEPDIAAVPGLTADLQYLEGHPNEHVDSDAILYKDAN